jgi:Domain of unknown function (DUF4337)
MSHGTEHHLEEAEHAQHHAADPFNQRVAMSMAMIAASLAFITMLSHKAHNETLQHQIHSNDNLTEASNQWGYFQAKKNRQYMFEANAKLLTVLSKDMKEESRKEAEKLAGEWKETVKEYGSGKNNIGTIEEKARELTKKAEELNHEAVHAHHMGVRFDLGELGIEMALVFCSLAVLTKRKEFWFSGITVGLLGFGVALSAYWIG